jgi:hypothetical protein
MFSLEYLPGLYLGTLGTITTDFAYIRWIGDRWIFIELDEGWS